MLIFTASVTPPDLLSATMAPQPPQGLKQSPRTLKTSSAASPVTSSQSLRHHEATTASMEDNIVEVDEAVVSAVDEAFGMMMSVAETQSSKVDVATTTMLKMLTNLASNKTEEKFRSMMHDY